MQLAALVQALCDARVDFVVIGGVSAVLHGSVTVTFDLDVAYDRPRDNLRCLAAALAPFHPRPRGFPPELPFIWDATTLSNATVSTLQTSAGAIDLLGEVAGIGPYEEVKRNSIFVEAFGRRFATLDLPSLIRAKRAAGREKDVAAIPELESLLDAREPG
jgi:hypothetical protein